MFTPFTVMGCSLELLKSGEVGIVTVCQSQDETIRKKLILMGIKTGNTITVEQQFPTFVIKCGEFIYDYKSGNSTGYLCAGN